MIAHLTTIIRITIVGIVVNNGMHIGSNICDKVGCYDSSDSQARIGICRHDSSRSAFLNFPCLLISSDGVVNCSINMKLMEGDFSYKFSKITILTSNMAII